MCLYILINIYIYFMYIYIYMYVSLHRKYSWCTMFIAQIFGYMFVAQVQLSKHSVRRTRNRDTNGTPISVDNECGGAVVSSLDRSPEVPKSNILRPLKRDHRSISEFVLFSNKSWSSEKIFFPFMPWLVVSCNVKPGWINHSVLTFGGYFPKSDI